MEVLFVCKANAGRSQMAEAMFNKLAEGRATATSAGTEGYRYEGKQINEYGKAATVMKEIGIDIAGNVVKGLTERMFDEADIVIFMVDRLGGPDLPEYALESSKVRTWDVPDHYTAEVRDLIYGRVSELVEEIKVSEADMAAKKRPSKSF